MDAQSYGGGKSSFFQRLGGVFIFRPAMYREIAEDEEASGSAILVVILFSIVSAIISGIFLPIQIQTQLQQLQATDPQTYQQIQLMMDQAGLSMATLMGAGTLIIIGISVIITPIFSLIGWLIFSWLCATVVNAFFGGNTSTNEMLRVFGFAYVFAPLSAIPCLNLVAWVLSVVANIIGIREASNIGTGGAILAWLVSVIILIVAFSLLCCGLGFALSLLVGAASSG